MPNIEYSLHLAEFEVLHRLMGSEGAHILREHMREASQNKQDTYIYRDALMAYLNVRAVARCETYTQPILDRLDQLMERESKVLDILIKAAEPSRLLSVAALGNAGYSPLNRSFDGEKRNRVSRFVRKCEQLLAFRLRWSICVLIAVTLILWIPTFLVCRSWRNAELARSAQLRQDDYAEARSWAIGQINDGLQNLEPMTYRLAERLERKAQVVYLPSGQRQWKIHLTGDDGITNVEWTPNVDLVYHWVMTLDEEPGRIALSKASASPTPP